MNLSILIVNWNTREMLTRCLDSLRLHAPTTSYEVIVVDNGSRDGSVERVRSEFPEVQVIANSDNRGYAIANNQAADVAKGETLLLLNSDIVVTPGAIDSMLAALESTPEAGAVACKLCYPDGRPQPSCRSFPDLSVLWFEVLGLSRLFRTSPWFGRYRMSHWDHQSTRFVDQPMMSCLLVRREAWTAVRGLDPTFPIYFNDVDWAYRTHQAGWRILYTAEAFVYHEHGGSTRKLRWKRVLIWHRALLDYHRKHSQGRMRSWKLAALLLLMTISLPAMGLRDAMRSFGGSEGC